MACTSSWRRLRGARESLPGYNLVRDAFSGTFAPHGEDPEYRDRLRCSLVADLRIAAARYPADRYPADRRVQQLLDARIVLCTAARGTPGEAALAALAALAAPTPGP